MAEKYKVLQRANVSEQYLVAWKVFGSWDHAITNAITALSKQRHIATSLKVCFIDSSMLILFCVFQETLMEARKMEDKGIK